MPQRKTKGKGPGKTKATTKVKGMTKTKATAKARATTKVRGATKTEAAIKTKTKELADRQKRGLKAVIKGLSFEKKVGEYVSKKGFTVQYERPIGKDKFDVFGQREDDWGDREYFIVECKDKKRVASSDVLHFMKKLQRFHKEDYETHAMLAYTGELPKDAIHAAKGFVFRLTFKRF